MVTKTRNSVEQIKIDVAKDVAAKNLTQAQADAVVAAAEEIAATPTPTSSASIGSSAVLEVTRATEPTPTSSASIGSSAVLEVTRGGDSAPATSTPASDALKQIKAALGGSVDVNIGKSALEAADVEDSQIREFLSEQSDVREINEARDEVNQALASGATVSRSALKAAAIGEAETKQILNRQAALRQVDAALGSGASVGSRTLRRAGVSEKAIKDLQVVQAARAKIGAITGVKQDDGSFDLGKAVEGGATRKNLLDAEFDPAVVDDALAGSSPVAPEERSKANKQLQQALEDASAFIDNGEIEIDRAVDSGVSLKTLKTLGVSSKAIDSALRRQTSRDFAGAENKVKAAATSKLSDFLDDQGRVSTLAALRAGVDSDVLRDYGLSRGQIKAAEQLAQEIRALEQIEVEKPDNSLTQNVKDHLIEAFTFGKAETATFNTADVRKKWIKAKGALSDEYDKAEKEAAADGQLLLTSKDDFITQNIGTRKAYVNSIMAAQPGLAHIAKEFGLASIPVYGTMRTWNDSPNWARALSIASDLLFIVPVAGQVGTATKAGTGFARGVANVGVATFTGPAQALRHPIQATKTALRPFQAAIETAATKRIPLGALEVRESTLRLPVVQGYDAIPGHMLKIPKTSLQQLDPESGLISRAGKLQDSIRLEQFRGMPNEPAIRGLMEWRDAATLNAIKGEGAGASVLVRDGGAFEGTLLAPKAQSVVGAAAFHGTPDLRSFMLGTTIGERDLFVAPSVVQRFIKANATGTLPDLPPLVQEAVALGQIAKKPIPGALMIRDAELLETLTATNKLWRGAAEIERTLPAGTKIPPPSQFLPFRGANGEPFTLAVIGKPLTPAEILNLKLVGSAENIKAIFKRPGRLKANDVTDAVAAADDSVELLGKASAAQARGAAGEANSFRLQAAAAQAKSEAHLLKAKQAAADQVSKASLSPVALYTGTQDLLKAIRALGKGSGKTTKRALAQARRNGGVMSSRETVLARGAGGTTKLGTAAVQAVRSATRSTGTPGRSTAGVATTRAAAPGAGGRRTRVADPKNDVAPNNRRGPGDRAKDPGRAKPTAPTFTRRSPGPGIDTTRRPPPPEGDTTRRPPPPGGDTTRRPPPPGGDTTRRPPPPGGDTTRRPPPPGGDTTRRTPPPPRRPPPGTPPPRRTPPPPEGTPRTPPPRFSVPGGRTLNPGEFPEVVEWPQGEVTVRFDLRTGKASYTDRKPNKRSPEDGFRIVTKGKNAPATRTFNMGIVDVVITQDGLDFVAAGKPLKDKTFSRGRGRGSRGLGRIRRGAA